MTHTMLCLSPCRAFLVSYSCFDFFSARCGCHLDVEDVMIPYEYTTNVGLEETGQVKRAIGGMSYRCRLESWHNTMDAEPGRRPCKILVR